ncbi:hypothetical protein [Pedobacter agri]|uniref:hypothetical protein n=1 Tax=Pedobacter agri TaxID=454586 RepID=UPI002931280A|nr:hypothetical protein [Pedobacter agri]
MRYLFIITLIITSNQLFAQQQINGQVLDHLSKLPVENAVITYGNQVNITSGTGKFSFSRNASAQMIKIKKLGYEDYELNLNNNFKDVVVLLKSTVFSLDDVTIYSKRDYLKDSLQMREDFAKVFAYEAPTIKDVLVKKGLRYPTFGSNLVSNSTSSILSFDVLKTIGLLNKNQSSISKLKKVQLKDEETNYINNRFSPEKINAITKLEDDLLQSFIDRYRPSSAEIRKMNDYEILMYVKKSYAEFVKSNKD